MVDSFVHNYKTQHMCLAIPGRIIQIINPNDSIKQALVDFGGIRKEISIAWVDAHVGEYVLAHAGMAISVIDETEAQLTIEALNAVDGIDLKFQSAR